MLVSRPMVFLGGMGVNSIIMMTAYPNMASDIKGAHIFGISIFIALILINIWISARRAIRR